MAAPFKWFSVTMLIERDARLNELAQGPVTMLSRTTACRAPTSRIPPNRKSVDGAVATIVFPSIRTLSRDRKSTRLNSSHGYISYAVFCLKKKKTQPPDSDTPTDAYQSNRIR